MLPDPSSENSANPIKSIKKLFEKGEYSQCLNDITEFLQRTSNLEHTLEARIYQVHCFIKKGEYDKALQLAKSCVEESTTQSSLLQIQSNIAMISALRYKGKLNEALDRIADIEPLFAQAIRRENLDIKESKATLIHLKGMIHRDKGELDKALEFSEESLKLGKEGNLSQLIADSLNNIGIIYMRKGELDTSLGHYIQSLEIRRKIGNPQDIASTINNIAIIYSDKGDLDTALDYYEQSLEIRKRTGNPQDIARSINNIGVMYWRKGDIDTALDHYQKGLEINQEIGNPRDIALSLNNVGSIYYNKGELDTALSYQQQSLEIRKNIGNQQDIAMTLNNIGIIYSTKGELDTALNYNQQSLDIRKKIGNPQDIAYSLNSIGFIYSIKGELDNALNYFQQSLEIRKKIGNQQEIAYSLNDIGVLYWRKGELDTALKYRQQSLEIHKDIGNRQHIAEILLGLIPLHLERQEHAQATQCLQSIKNIASLDEFADNKTVQLQYKLAQALIFKSKKRVRYKSKAQELLEEIVTGELINFEINNLAYKHLVDLLLDELKTYGEPEVLDEIVKHINKMHERAIQEKIVPIIIESLILKSKLAVIQGNLDMANELLRQAVEKAEGTGLTHLYNQAKEEKELMENEFYELQKFLEKNQSMSERVNKMRLMEYLEKVRKFSYHYG